MRKLVALWITQAAWLVQAFAGDALHLSISAAQQDWIAGEPVILKLSITNASAQHNSVFLGEAGVGAISFSTNQNDWVGNTLGRRSGLLPGATRELPAHAGLTNLVILDEWLQLAPGLNRLAAQIAQPEGKALRCEFTLRVLPSDPVKLRERVLKLVNGARRGRIAEHNACMDALRVFYRRSPEGQRLLNEDLKVERELMGYIQVDPVD